MVYVQFADLDSQLPPFESGTKEWVRMEITGVDRDQGTFTAKAFGTEFPLNSKQEGKEEVYSFEYFTSKILNDNPQDAVKVLANQTGGEGIDQALKDAGYAGDAVGGTYLKDGKFHFMQIDEEGNETEQEATHFTTTDEVPDDKGSGVKKNTIIYKVAHNADGTVSVEGDVPDLEGEIKKYERKKMSKADFLLFVASKKLSPQTEASVQDDLRAMEDVRSHQKRSWSWVSPAAMRSSIK